MEHQWDSDRPGPQSGRCGGKRKKILRVVGIMFLFGAMFLGAVSEPLDAKPRKRGSVGRGSVGLGSVGQNSDRSAVSVHEGNEIVRFDNLRERDLLVERFELTERTRIDVQATGAAVGGGDMNAYGWILDASTREPVWSMDENDADYHGRSKILRDIDDHITLPAGTYEAYYYVGPQYSWGASISISDWEDLEQFFEELGDKIGELGDNLDSHLNELFDGDEDSAGDEHADESTSERRERLRKKWRDGAERFFVGGGGSGLSRKELRALEMTVTSEANTFKKLSADDGKSELDIVNFTRVMDDERLRQGFSLKKATTVRINAEGEYSGSGNIFVDQGWIINAGTGERIWDMDKWSTRYAGGAKKNRYAREDVTLPAGNYVVFYSSDDSHSFERWNAPPPNDPLNYGIRVSVTDPADKSYVGSYEYDPDKNVIFALDKARNDDYLTQGFTLTKPTKLRILCYGEYAFNRFVDYGWIEDISTMEPVWEMTEDNTSYGGGAKKNRVFNDVITLPAGDYMAGFLTDDSHAYRSWNSDKPFEPEKWGLTVYGVGEHMDKNAVKLFDEAPEGSGALVSLIRVGDDEEVSDSFTLEEPTKVTISALGEGMNGRMYDYGWIEDANTGRIVWKMRYRKTRNAGGAEKNRMVTATVELGPGTYDVVFVTDDSHSFQRFNARKPRNPDRWGITVSRK